MARRLFAALALFARLGVANAESVDRSCPGGSALHESAGESRCETPSGVGEGPFWVRREDGSLRLWGTASAGKIEGRWIAWHPNGAKSIEATYRGGELVGLFQMWDAGGQRIYAGTHDANGEMDGTWRRWWSNGRERIRFSMRHGNAHGEVVTFFESGDPRFEGRRENGRREGRWTWWDEHGDVVARCRYENDTAVEGTCGE